MVARIVARFVITVRLNFFSMGCKDGADHPGMTHGHDVRAALFNHKFQRMTHQSKRMVLATMG